MVIRLQELHTFFVVARAGAMQKAASELGVTPGAISQRISAIERQHGKRLFVRSRNGIALTAAGEALWRDVETEFSNIEAARNRHFRGELETHIRISAAPTFAHACLVPQLGTFSKMHPHIKITIETDQRLVDLKSEPIDLAIRHGLGNYAGCRSQWLSSPELIVVASPDLLRSGEVIDNAEDCLSYLLLQDSNAVCSDWQLWCQARGLDESRARFGPAFRDDFLIVKAAVAGQGLALLHDIYVRDELSSGQLVKACNAAWPTKFAYYAVAQPATFKRPAIRQFVAWLKSVSGNELEQFGF